MTNKRIQKNINLLIEDFDFKRHFLLPFNQWQVLKQIENYCFNNEAEIPQSIKFALKIHEIAAARDGVNLIKENRATLEFVSYKKNQNVNDGNCMFFHKKIKLRHGNN